MKPASVLATGAIAAGGAIVLALSTGASQAPSETAYGFVLTRFNMEFYRGDEKVDCPEGRSHSVREAFLATQSPAERDRLLRPENSVEFEKKYKVDYVYGKNGRDICTDSALFDTPDREVQKTVQSKIGPGMDLDGAEDGKAAPGVCAHQGFTSPTGEAGVDNQFFRVVACNTFWRGAATGVGDALQESAGWAINPTVVIVRNVQSWTDDPEVEVMIASSPDKLALDASQKVASGVSLAATSDPRYRNLLKGRIKDGVLTTDPADLTLHYHWNVASGGEYIVKHLRLRARLNPQGELTGQAGGYRPIDNAIAVTHVGGPGIASTAGLECASVRKTLRLFADGDPDPTTGQCTSVSTALALEAKPAYVFDQGVLLAGPRPDMVRAAHR